MVSDKLMGRPTLRTSKSWWLGSALFRSLLAAGSDDVQIGGREWGPTSGTRSDVLQLLAFSSVPDMVLILRSEIRESCKRTQYRRMTSLNRNQKRVRTLVN